jgi:hypothetical protein
MFSPVMKDEFIWIILGTQCGLLAEFPGQQNSKGILELEKF